MHHAAGKGNVEIMQLLRKQGTNRPAGRAFNSFMPTYASFQRRSQPVQRLQPGVQATRTDVTGGADVDIQNAICALFCEASQTKQGGHMEARASGFARS